MFQFSPWKKLALLLLVCFFLSGCSASEKLKEVDKKLGEIFEMSDNGQTTEDSDDNQAENIDPNSGELTEIQKSEIDLWLEANGFNRYGDPKDTFYTGGTPLFDEETGETIERFEYILERHPDILQKINN